MNKIKLNIQLFADQVILNNKKSNGAKPYAVYTVICTDVTNRQVGSVDITLKIQARLNSADSSLQKGPTMGLNAYNYLNNIQFGPLSLKSTSTCWSGTTWHNSTVTYTVTGLTATQTSIATAFQVNRTGSVANTTNTSYGCWLKKTSGNAVTIPAATVGITYYRNHNSTDTGIITTQSVGAGTAISVAGAPGRTGYTFYGWYTNRDNTGSRYYPYTNPWPSYIPSDVPTTITPTANTNLYAGWSINSYYLDLNGRLSSDGGSTYTEPGGLGSYGKVDVYINGSRVATDVNDYYTQHPYGTSYNITNIRANAGYKYEGVYSGSTNSTIGAATTYVYLQFRTIKYTIAYNANGGSGAPNAQTKVYGTNITLQSGTPSRSGYTFVGWYLNGAGTGTQYSPGQTLSSDLTTTDGATVTLYAKWTMIPPTNVRFTSTQVTGPFNISLAWDATGLDINYTIQYKVVGAANYIDVDCGSSKSLSLAVNEETSYEIRIKAVNSGGTVYTNPITLTTPADQAKIRIYNSSTWLQGKTYIYNGSSWVKAKKVYIYDGSQWKINSNN